MFKKIFLLTALAFPFMDASASMVKCKIVKDGQGLIKAHKADCKTTSHSCAGQNKSGDPESWIMIPVDYCDKLQKSNFNNIPDKIMRKLDLED